MLKLHRGARSVDRLLCQVKVRERVKGLELPSFLLATSGERLGQLYSPNFLHVLSKRSLVLQPHICATGFHLQQLRSCSSTGFNRHEVLPETGSLSCPRQEQQAVYCTDTCNQRGSEGRAGRFGPCHSQASSHGRTASAFSTFPQVITDGSKSAREQRQELPQNVQAHKRLAVKLQHSPSSPLAKPNSPKHGKEILAQASVGLAARSHLVTNSQATVAEGV